MKEVLSLTNRQIKVANALLGKYVKQLEFMGYPTLNAVSVRKTMTTGTTSVIDFFVDEKGHLHISVTNEKSVLFMKPVTNEDFDIVLNMNEPKLSVVKMPQSRKVIKWLDKEVDKDGHTNLQAILQDYIPFEFTKTFLGFALTKKVVNGQIEVRPVDDFEKVVEDGLVANLIAYRKAHITDGWDVVSVTEVQVEKVVKTLTETHIKLEHENTALPKFCLSLYSNHLDTTQYWFFERKGNKLYAMTEFAEISDKDKLGFLVEFNGGIATLVECSDDFMREPCTKGDSQQMWEFITQLYISINTFMIHFRDVSFNVEEKIAKAPSEKKKSHKHGRNSVRLFKCYTLKRGWKGEARKKIEVTCPAWGVRGHFRHYRNGKTVFIEAYVKGKERELYKGKEYTLLPYKEA